MEEIKFPFWNFYGSRESSNAHSELFKDKLIEYMQIKGYTRYENSKIEGCLSDLIFINHDLFGNTETHCEVKWDVFSLGDAEIRKEFNKYLLLYLRLPQSHKFRFMIVTRKLASSRFNLRIFEKYKETEINEFMIGEKFFYSRN